MSGGLGSVRYQGAAGADTTTRRPTFPARSTVKIAIVTLPASTRRADVDPARSACKPECAEPGATLPRR